MNKRLLKEAHEIAEEMFVYAKEFCRAHSIPAKSRFEYMKLFMETSSRVYTSAAIAHSYIEVTDAIYAVSHAITLAAEDEEALQELENAHFTLRVANGGLDGRTH